MKHGRARASAIARGRRGRRRGCLRLMTWRCLSSWDRGQPRGGAGRHAGGAWALPETAAIAARTRRVGRSSSRARSMAGPPLGGSPARRPSSSIATRRRAGETPNRIARVARTSPLWERPCRDAATGACAPAWPWLSARRERIRTQGSPSLRSPPPQVADLACGAMTYLLATSVHGHLFWITSRAAGTVALLLSSVGVGLGLTMSTKLLRGGASTCASPTRQSRWRRCSRSPCTR